MIGLDTNVLVRYIAQDDARQSLRATALIESFSNANRGFVSLVAIVELVWVMDRSYRATKGEIVAIIGTLLRIQTIVVENAEVIQQAVHLYATSTADFADCLIERSAHQAQCSETVTFDRKAAKIAGMHLLV
jgi:predicted nucleic-acid-binding protein